jgi:ATP-binding cassette, subfamily F, member 3
MIQIESNSTAVVTTTTTRMSSISNMDKIRRLLEEGSDAMVENVTMIDYWVNVLQEQIIMAETEANSNDDNNKDTTTTTRQTLQSILEEFVTKPQVCQEILDLLQQVMTEEKEKTEEGNEKNKRNIAKKKPKETNGSDIMRSMTPPPKITTTTSTFHPDPDNSTAYIPKSRKERRKERRLTKRIVQNRNKQPTTTTTIDKKQQDYHSSDNDNHSSTDDSCETNSSSSHSRYQHPTTTTTATTTATSTNIDQNDLLELNDHSSAWQQAQADGTLWGGRGKGGRGVRYYGDNYTNLHLPSSSLQFQGRVLLEDSVMTIDKGHRYGLLGRNGVGKSTLFRALAEHWIPGLPHQYRVMLVNQQLDGSDTITALQAVLQADTDRTRLLQEQEQIERDLEQGINVLENAQRLEQLLLEWDAMDGDHAEERAKDILKGLGFNQAMMVQQPSATLSGGWRMRLSLARALFVQHTIDLLLLDEVSNHLDLHGMIWLQQYLTSSTNKCQDLTMIVISHDRDFLGAVTTDMIVMNHQRLTYHPGNYWDYQRQIQERTAMQSNKLEAAEKQRQKAIEFVQKQQIHSNDPNKQRQAKMIKEKKLDRIGMFREDGKRFHNFSLAKLDGKFVRMAQHVNIEREERVMSMKFPNPTWPPSVHDTNSPVITLENLSFRYNNSKTATAQQDVSTTLLLHNLTLHVNRGSKIAVVGKNGCGKSTLIKLLTGELPGQDGTISSGRILRHGNIRIGHVSQYSVEELEQYYGHLTVVEYAERYLQEGRASSRAIANASSKGYGTNNIRQYLGSFGLGGEQHAHRLIKTLSGGERMRLCFCTVLADEPHVLILDESSNHLDLETLDNLAAALHAFHGAIVMVSHNQGFLRVFANTLWVCDDHDGQQQVEARYSDQDSKNTTTASFDELFGQYRSQVLMSSDAVASRSNARRMKAELAKRAGKQSHSSRTALLV